MNYSLFYITALVGIRAPLIIVIVYKMKIKCAYNRAQGEFFRCFVLSDQQSKDILHELLFDYLRCQFISVTRD